MQKDAGASLSYTTLLNDMTENGSLAQWQKDLGGDTEANFPDMQTSSLTVNDLAKVSRLQVFEEIPDALSDSVISFE